MPYQHSTIHTYFPTILNVTLIFLPISLNCPFNVNILHWIEYETDWVKLCNYKYTFHQVWLVFIFSKRIFKFVSLPIWLSSTIAVHQQPSTMQKGIVKKDCKGHWYICKKICECTVNRNETSHWTFSYDIHSITKLDWS